MSCRRGQQLSLPDLSALHEPNPVDQLTLSCMMCKMDSSTDSDSEISPMWSDTSTLGCGSSAPKSRTSRRIMSLTHKSAGRNACCSLLLDPYDGSSEDSDESNGGTARLPRQHSKGGQRRPLFLHRSASLTVSEMMTDTTRESLHHQGDGREVQMKLGRCSELWDCEPVSGGEGCRRTPDESESIHAMDVEVQLDDSGLKATRSSTCCTPGLYISEESSWPQILSSCSEKSLRALCKRKELPPEAEPVEAEPRKRRCVLSTADERGETG